MSVLKGKGTTIGVNASSGATVAIAQVKEISGPNRSVGTVESTNLSSTSRTFLTTIPDGGEVTFTVQFDPTEATHVTLDTLAKTPDDTVAWLITLTNADTIGFSGLLTGYNVTGMGVDGLLECEITIKVTGDVTVS